MVIAWVKLQRAPQRSGSGFGLSQRAPLGTDFQQRPGVPGIYLRSVFEEQPRCLALASQAGDEAQADQAVNIGRISLKQRAVSSFGTVRVVCLQCGGGF
jgi:hypothetical protein